MLSRPTPGLRSVASVWSLAPRRGPAERFIAWLYLGPVGHFYGVVADVVELGGRYWLARTRGRAPR